MAFDWKITSKAKQKNLHKQVKNPATEKGERWSIDIASMKNTSNSGSKYWLLIVDDFLNMMWSFFLKKKSETSQMICNLIKDEKVKHQIMVKSIRCDNAGENLILEKDCRNEGLGIQFEFTAPGTPQQNGKVE